MNYLAALLIHCTKKSIIYKQFKKIKDHHLPKIPTQPAFSNPKNVPFVPRKPRLSQAETASTQYQKNHFIQFSSGSALAASLPLRLSNDRFLLFLLRSATLTLRSSRLLLFRGTICRSCCCRAIGIGLLLFLVVAILLLLLGSCVDFLVRLSLLASVSFFAIGSSWSCFFLLLGLVVLSFTGLFLLVGLLVGLLVVLVL